MILNRCIETRCLDSSDRVSTYDYKQMQTKCQLRQNSITHSKIYIYEIPCERWLRPEFMPIWQSQRFANHTFSTKWQPRHCHCHFGFDIELGAIVQRVASSTRERRTGAKIGFGNDLKVNRLGPTAGVSGGSRHRPGMAQRVSGSLFRNAKPRKTDRRSATTAPGPGTS